MKKISLLSPLFYREPTLTRRYNSCLAGELVLDGCKVDVFCSHSLCPNWIVEKTDLNISDDSTTRQARLHFFVKEKVCNNSPFFYLLLYFLSLYV